MAYNVTYNSLQQDVRRYIERGFTAESDPMVYEQIPRLINYTERRIASELKIQGFIRAVTTQLQVGVSVYDKPDRWRDTISMTVNGEPIFTRVYEYLRSYWPDPAKTGKPEFYGDYDYQHWLIVPTPMAVAQLEILYYEMPQLLDDGNQENWLTAYAPNLLLYGVLLECAPFLKNDERIPVWQQMYDRAASVQNGQDLQKILDRSAVRSEA